METSYKCQTSLDSFIDTLFVAFSQSYLVKAVQDFATEHGKDSSNRVRVLDLGCYNGRLFQFMIQHRLYTQYIGIDVRNDYLEKSPYKRRKDVTLLCEDVTQGLTVPDDSIDIVVSSEVLEHINSTHWPDVFKHIYRVLDKDGLFVVGFPMNTEGKHFHYPEKEKSLGHVNFPVHESFIEMGKDAGFEFVKFDSCYSLKSSYRIPKEIKESKFYKRLRERCGSQVARAWAMTVDDDHTGGAFYTFKK